MKLSACLLLAILMVALGTKPVQGQSIVTIATGIDAVGVAVDGAGNVFVADQGDGAVLEFFAASSYTTAKALADGFVRLNGIAVDGSGNVFVSDAGNNVTSPTVYQLPAANGYATIDIVFRGSNPFGGIAVDASGNIFITDSFNNAVREFLAAGGYVRAETIGSGFNQPLGIKLDRDGNLFVADNGNFAVKEILAAGGYTTIETLFHGFSSYVAVDATDNLFVLDPIDTGVKEALASSGYSTVETIGSGLSNPFDLALDKNGNIFVADFGHGAVKEILTTAPAILASVLPGSRSVQLDEPATIFGTMINSGTNPLMNCRIALPATAPLGLTLSYQTTDPMTNALTGTPNTPITIPGGNGSQSFLVTFLGTEPFSVVSLPLVFACDSTPSAATFPGVNTVDLVMSSMPLADVIVLAATPTNNGVVNVPSGGAAAFAIASTNIGAAASLTVSVDTGAALLPLMATICQTASTGQCFAPPGPSQLVSYAAGATPTFSVFLQATGGAIPFDPVSSRIFVRLMDANGESHGSASVAVETN